ncbi:MAG: hypothetical protein EXR33_12300 [Betaproteobacteria bacterium]|nr:hypothetical protein [Betaproteobacteria bacterium]
MVRFLRKGVLFALLFAGIVTPAAADPILMFLLGIARDMVISHVAKSSFAPAPEPVPDVARFYPGTSVEPDHLRRLIDDSFPYLNDAQRREIYGSLKEALTDPKNAAVRGPMIEYFADKALTVRAAQQKLAQLSSGEKESLAAGFRKEINTLSVEEQTQLGELLRNRLLPIPSDLNQMLLAAFDTPR